MDRGSLPDLYLCSDEIDSPPNEGDDDDRSAERRDPSLARLRGAGGVLLHDDRRPDDRERRAADDRARPPLFRVQPAVGRNRLWAYLRRIPAARGPPCRPTWSEA